MLSRTQISLIVGLTAVLWAAVLLTRGIAFSLDQFLAFGATVTGLTLLTSWFNTRCWRFGVFKGWLVQRPWVQGTWRVTLESSWIDPATNKTVPPISGFMVFRQTFSSLSARFYTKESSSETVTATVLQAPDCVFQVSAAYRNEPTPKLRGVRSEIHFGAFVFDVHGDPPNSLSGKYWTDRKTNGTMVLEDRNDRLITSFEEGSRLYDPKTDDVADRPADGERVEASP
ncbi:MAG: hypothetical protein WAU68_16495 [Vitreimonas sp.]